MAAMPGPISGKSWGRDDRFHPRHRLGRGGVDRFDSGVGVRAAQDLAVQQAGQTDIGTILRPTGDFIDPVVPNRTCPDDLEFMFLLGSHVYLPLHFSGGVLDRSYDLVIAGTAAEIAGQGVTNFMLSGVGVPVQQGFGCDQKAGGADAALEGGVLQGISFGADAGLSPSAKPSTVVISLPRPRLRAPDRSRWGGHPE